MDNAQDNIVVFYGGCIAVCRLIAARPICADTGARLHFVDDRLETLLAVREAADMDKWNLYLADW